jgi:hypothetical protein
LGQIPEYAREEDEVWVFPGLRVPFVLRKEAVLDFRLAGESYTSGITYGEALDIPGQEACHIKLI